MKTDNKQEQVSQYRWCETERTESPLLVLVNASYSCTTTSAAMVIITAYRVWLQAANKCISTSAATEVRCSDARCRDGSDSDRGGGPGSGPQSADGWSVAPWSVVRAQSARTLECRQYVSSEQRGPLGGRGGDGEL